MLVLLLARLAPGQYAGSKTCGSCHPQQYSQHAKSGHARALAPSSGPKAIGEWAFGAGDQAVTYVSRVDEDYYLEHGLTYYTASKSMGITPGHRNKEGERYRIFDPEAAILRCFQCHSTGPLHLGKDFRIEPAEAGVHCEGCHGPGASHAASQQPIRNPGKLNAVDINSLCGTCHRMPAAAGDDTDWTNAWNVRHQPLYLNESPCFTKSKESLSCLTCHTAHQPVSRNTAQYNRKCDGCHPKPQHKTAIAGHSCVGCHMPDVKPHPDLRFANHWIGIYAAGAPLRPIERRP